MGHVFVESSPPPPTENARAGADEASIDIPVREILNRHGLPAPNIDTRWNMNIVSAVREAYAAGRARGIEEERATTAEQRRQLTILQRAQRERNLALDAMHWVWCDGGCKGGVHRWEGGELTEEIVELAEMNTKRLRSWFANKRFKAAYAEASARGEPFEMALASARNAIADAIAKETDHG